jgi:hypothetical protein
MKNMTANLMGGEERPSDDESPSGHRSEPVQTKAPKRSVNNSKDGDTRGHHHAHSKDNLKNRNHCPPVFSVWIDSPILTSLGLLCSAQYL